MSVTRTELANHIEAAFTTGPATRDNMLAYATGSHARPEVLATLARLKDKPYPSIRDIWPDLNDLPIGT